MTFQQTGNLLIIYNTPQLLELLGFCHKANVDGTLRTMSQLFEQLYMFLVEYKETSISCYMGVLPVKKRMSYHAFVLMILLEFHERFESEKLRLKKVKMAFELGLMHSNQSIFVRFNFPFFSGASSMEGGFSHQRLSLSPLEIIWDLNSVLLK